MLGPGRRPIAVAAGPIRLRSFQIHEIDEESGLKVRIFSLAKELEMDSKVLIQHCADAGLDVKNSPLASITEAERDQLMAHLATVDTTAPAEAESTEPLVPVREEVAPDRLGKVRQIKTLGPLGGTLRSRRGSDEESEAEEEEEAVCDRGSRRSGDGRDTLRRDCRSRHPCCC